MFGGPAGVCPEKERAVGAMGLAFAVGLEARGSKFVKLGRVGDLIWSGPGEKVGVGGRSH